MLMELKISLSIVGSVLKSILGALPKILNLCRRPKAKVEIKNQNIIFKDQNSIESHISYPCILISFKKDIKIDVRSIKINNETLHCMLSRDPNHLRQNPNSKEPHSIINNRIMPFVYNNWSQLTQKTFLFQIKSQEQEVFPLYIKEMSCCLFSQKKNPRLFFPKSKVTLSFDANGSSYEYGISLMEACKVIINNLSSKPF